MSPNMNDRDSPYRCEYCGLGLHPDDRGVAKYRSGWQKNGSSTLHFGTGALRYAHWVCVETDAGKIDTTPALF